MSQVKEHPCGIHDLVYVAVRAGCPACALEKRADDLLTERDALRREVDQLRVEVDRVRATADLTYSMKDAAAMLDAKDRTFLKQVLYLWRDEKSVDLVPLEDGRGFRVNGDMVAEHRCSSVGGIAICGFFREAIAAYGKGTAMNLLTRGMAQFLQGGG